MSGILEKFSQKKNSGKTDTTQQNGQSTAPSAEAQPSSPVLASREAVEAARRGDQQLPAGQAQTTASPTESSPVMASREAVEAARRGGQQQPASPAQTTTASPTESSTVTTIREAVEAARREQQQSTSQAQTTTASPTESSPVMASREAVEAAHRVQQQQAAIQSQSATVVPQTTTSAAVTPSSVTRVEPQTRAQVQSPAQPAPAQPENSRATESVSAAIAAQMNAGRPPAGASQGGGEPPLQYSSNTAMKPDKVQDCLLFLAHYFNRSVERDHLIGGVPLPEGRITVTELHECAGRAGLSVTLSQVSPEKVKSTMFPVLVMDNEGDAVVVLHRDGAKVECALPGVKGTQWMPLTQLLKEHAGEWYFVRPEFHFDARSLLYGVEQPRRWFWDVFKSNRNIYLWALTGTVVINLLAIVLPFYTMAVYDRVIPNNALESLWVLTTAAVAVTLFDLLMKVLRGYLLEAAARKADIVLSTHIFAHSLRLRAATRPASGGVLANVVRDFETVRDFFTSATLTVLGDLPFMFLFFAIIALVGGWLAAIPFILVPIAIMVSLGLRKVLSKLLNESTKESAQRTAHLFEVMNGLDIVKGLGAEAWARRKWEALTLRIAESNLHMHEVTNFNAHIIATLIGFNTILLVVFGSLMISENQLTMGQLIAVIMLSSRAITPMATISSLIVRWEQTKISLGVLDKVMASATDDKVNSLHVNNLRGAVELRDVSFAYPNNQPLLKGVSIKINPGEKVGFIGRIGSGKSTVLKLLLNLYEPAQGAVLVDGVQVGQMDALSLRRQVGYVPQDVVLFHGNLRENILLSGSNVTDEELLQAIRTACLEETLTQMPGGLNSEVGERGERLSGGQRQAVAIARALVRKPKLLLMDEPSSMMDPATENMLISNLRQMKDTTVLLVTHRTAMLAMVDRLVVMDQGRILLDGPRDEVLRRLQGGGGAPAAGAQPASPNNNPAANKGGAA